MSWVDRVQTRVAERSLRPHGGRPPGRARKTFVMPPFWSQGYHNGEIYGGGRVAITSAVYGGSYGSDREPGGDGYENYAQSVYKGNGIVFSCTVARARVFSQARFQFQKFEGGRPTEFFGVPGPGAGGLNLLERPWQPSGTTGELLTSMEVDGSIAGNAYHCVVDSEGRIGRAHDPRDPDRFVSRMRPDWVTLILDAPSGNPYNVDARVVALAYAPPGMRDDPLILLRSEFAHYSPLPDPTGRFRGMTWLTPILRDIAADNAYTTHKTAFLRNGATPNLVVKVGDDVEDDDFNAFVEQFRRDYEGAPNAYKTLFLAGGADVTPLSVDFKQLEMQAAQGSLETRIASAAGVHPAIAGLSEGLQGSTLNEGNSKAARRLFVDSTIRDLWSKAAPAMETLVPPPDKSRQRLWYDARDIPFLREDVGDEANTFLTQMQSINVGITAGYNPDDMARAAKAADVSLLIGKHTGMVSVQLQPPGAVQQPPSNGNGGPDTVPTLDIQSNGSRRPLATVGR